MSVNLNLKAEPIKRFGSQVEATKSLGIRENRLSYIIRGHTEPTEREQKTLGRCARAGNGAETIKKQLSKGGKK